MIIIRLKTTSPFFNLACEEYLIRNFTDDVVMIWQNHNSVIIGKNQNTAAEVNPEFIKDHGITVARRLTGGGAVYHDLGNVNFSFISSYDSNLGFDYFATPVVECLKSFGTDAFFGGRNDIMISGKKVSGTAKTVINGKVLYHGTLLYNSDLTVLSKALIPSKAKMESKGIKSVSARVGNIIDFMPNKLDTDHFLSSIYSYLKEYTHAEEYTLSENDTNSIQQLSDNKFSKWEWNYGYSPDYSFSNEKHFPYGNVSVRMNISSGIIQNVSVTGDYFGDISSEMLCNALVGCKHDFHSILDRIIELPINRIISGATADDIAFVVSGI